MKDRRSTKFGVLALQAETFHSLRGVAAYLHTYLRILSHSAKRLISQERKHEKIAENLAPREGSSAERRPLERTISILACFMTLKNSEFHNRSASVSVYLHSFN